MGYIRENGITGPGGGQCNWGGIERIPEQWSDNYPTKQTILDTIRMQRSLAGGDGRLRKRREWTISSLRCSFTLLSELLILLLACLALLRWMKWGSSLWERGRSG